MIYTTIVHYLNVAGLDKLYRNAVRSSQVRWKYKILKQP